MSIDYTTTYPETHPEAHAPARNPALERLDVLVGTWELVGRESGPLGEIRGRVRFEWLEGSHFLIQHVDVDHIGQRVKGVEIIGYGRDWDGTVSQDCISHYFDNEGNAFIYTWDVDADSLTIWGGRRGSPAAFRGSFSDDRNMISGAWQWPGGGYEATMTRVKDE